MATRLLLIGLGGFLGSVLRYLLSGAVQFAVGSMSIPAGTMAVNVVGCFAAGFVAEIAETRGALTELQRLFVLVGFLGGFTTFSAFAGESVNLVRDGEHGLAMLNVAVQVLVCLAAVWAGRSVAFTIWR
jgi:CrcB protein